MSLILRLFSRTTRPDTATMAARILAPRIATRRPLFLLQTLYVAEALHQRRHGTSLLNVRFAAASMGPMDQRLLRTAKAALANRTEAQLNHITDAQMESITDAGILAASLGHLGLSASVHSDTGAWAAHYRAPIFIRLPISDPRRWQASSTDVYAGDIIPAGALAADGAYWAIVLDRIKTKQAA